MVHRWVARLVCTSLIRSAEVIEPRVYNYTSVLDQVIR